METVLMPSFWNNMVYILKLMGTLVRVLRLVDNERRPAMGYIYKAMDRYKEAIDARWECQLYQPLHVAGHFLNPEIFYGIPNIEFDEEITSGLYSCIGKLIVDQDVQDKIMDELSLYRRVRAVDGGV